MSMTGGISFFDKNKALKADGASAAASSNSDNADLALGTNKYFRWESTGSDDLTTETLTITLPAAVDITRIFLIGHNFDTFQVKYDGSSDFLNVTGLDDYSANNISETGFTRDTAYYEFDSVNTDTINLSMDTTQTADAEKYIEQVIVTTELGTLAGFPQVRGPRLDRQFRKEEAVSGRMHIEKGFETFSCDLTLRDYPKQADIDLLDSLHDRDSPFLVWLNGGKPGQFTYTQRGWRLRDVVQVQTDGPLSNSYPQTTYVRGVNQRYGFSEVV